VKPVSAELGITVKLVIQQLSGDLNTAMVRAIQQFPDSPFIRFSGIDT
jgi:hypothetical protein